MAEPVTISLKGLTLVHADAHVGRESGAVAVAGEDLLRLTSTPQRVASGGKRHEETVTLVLHDLTRVGREHLAQRAVMPGEKLHPLRVAERASASLPSTSATSARA